MRRIGMFIALVCAFATPAAAQFGKSVAVQANTPEDRALNAIYEATDPAQKISLLDKFIAEFGQGDMALLADRLYVSAYAAEKNYDRAFEYGNRVLARDPDDLGTSVDLTRYAQEKGDLEKEFAYGERVGALINRFKAQAAPADTPAADWERKKSEALAGAKDQVEYVESLLFNSASQLKDPARKAALLERFATAFPNSPYTESAESLAAASYQQAQDFPKMLAFAQKVISQDPNNIAMRILRADYWSERGEELDQAQADVRKALELLANAKKSQGVTDEQWQQQIALQRGLADSVLGQIYVNRDRNAQAVEAFREASPLLKSNTYNYARNLYRLGFTLAKMRHTAEARTILAEAVSLDSPYRALAEQTLEKIGGPARRRTSRPE